LTRGIALTTVYALTCYTVMVSQVVTAGHRDLKSCIQGHNGHRSPETKN